MLYDTSTTIEDQERSGIDVYHHAKREAEFNAPSEQELGTFHEATYNQRMDGSGVNHTRYTKQVPAIIRTRPASRT